MELHVDTPWDERDLKSWRDLLEHVIKQLKYFLDTNQTPNRVRTIADLVGYETVFATHDEEIAKKFFQIKNWAKDSGKEFKNNLDIVRYMRKKGMKL